MQLSFSAAPVRSSPLPPRSGGEGSGAGGSAAYSEAAAPADRPPTPAPSPPRARARGGRGEHRARLCDLAARFARALPSISLPSHSEGAGNAGRPMRPIAACATIVVERTRVSQVTPESPGIPRAMVLRLIRALLGDLCLVATVVRGTCPATLAPASERQDHTTSPSASGSPVKRADRVHRIPLRVS